MGDGEKPSLHPREPTELRLLRDPPLDGAANMARDEALMLQVGAGESLPTLRLYRWSQPTISLGYFQPYGDCAKLDPPLRDLPVVRRSTGGGAILHDLELTYSLALPLTHPLVGNNPRGLYELAHAAVIATLAELGVAAARSGFSDDSSAARGPFFCFARRHEADLLLGDQKIAGSAQRRTRHAILQHGSIVLATRFTQHPTAVLNLPFEMTIEKVQSFFPPHFANRSKMLCNHGNWQPNELALASQLRGKYAGDEWTRRV